MNVHTHQTRSIRTNTIRTCIGIGIAAAASMTAAGTMTAASATHPVDGPGSSSAAARFAASHDVGSSPCFAARTWNRWPADVGEAPRCSHSHATSDSFAISAGTEAHGSKEDAAKPTQAMDSPCFMIPDHWNVTVDRGIPVCTTR